MFQYNFQPLLAKHKADLTRGASLPLSLTRCGSLVKRDILPKFLCLFQYMLILINLLILLYLMQRLTAFLWNNWPAHLRKSVLQLPKSNRSLSLPNFEQDYWACNIHKGLYWCNAQSASCPSWVYTEMSSSQVLLQFSSIQYYLCSVFSQHSIVSKPITLSVPKSRSE